MAGPADTLVSGAQQPDSLIGDRYRIVRQIGRGATKQVFLARDERLARDVARALAVGAQRGDAMRERVRREARLTAQLGEHPHIVTVFDAGEESGVAWMVSRLMRGGSLADQLTAA